MRTVLKTFVVSKFIGVEHVESTYRTVVECCGEANKQSVTLNEWDGCWTEDSLSVQYNLDISEYIYHIVDADDDGREQLGCRKSDDDRLLRRVHERFTFRHRFSSASTLDTGHAKCCAACADTLTGIGSDWRRLLFHMPSRFTFKYSLHKKRYYTSRN